MILSSKKKGKMDMEIINAGQEGLREKCKGGGCQNNKYAAMKATEDEVKRAQILAFLLLQHDSRAFVFKVN